MQSKVIYCRWSPTLGNLESSHQEVWGTTEYEGDRDEPTVFVGLYGLPDFYALWRHRGKKWIFWCGSDIRHFVNGYWLEEGGAIRIDPKPLAEWINKNCESWVENEVELQALAEIGIQAQVCPSFLGDVTKFEVSYQWSERPKLYTSCSGNDFELYQWPKVVELALDNPDIEFHLYGNTVEFDLRGGLSVVPSNFIVHGRVPKEQMNEEIKNMQGALRLVEFDGFSEIIAKSVLMGQWPVSLISYPFMFPVEQVGLLKTQKYLNIEGRNHYLKTLNQFPWNLKK